MGEIVVQRTVGEGLPVRPRRGLVEPIDARVTRSLGLALPADAGPVSEIGFDAQLGAIAAASKAALASDLACYLRWCKDIRVATLPAEPENLVCYIAMLEARGAKRGTVARSVASLATAHGLSGLQERGHAPSSHIMVRTALRGLRRRRGAAQRQAASLRFGASLDPHTKGFTLTALLGACGGDLQGLRDAALLSLGYDAGLRVSELVAVTVAHIDPHSYGSALLFIPSSKTDQEGQGAWGWLSADTMRRVGARLVASAITDRLVFRRVGVDRRRLRAVVPPMAYEAIPSHTRHWQEKPKGKKAEPVRTVYTIGTSSLSHQGVNGIYRRVALSAIDQGLVEMPIAKVEEAARALSATRYELGLRRTCLRPARTAFALHKRYVGRRRPRHCAMAASLQQKHVATRVLSQIRK